MNPRLIAIAGPVEGLLFDLAEDENRRLKQIVADLTLDNRVLKDVVSKKL